MADYYKMSHNVPNETKKTHAFEEYEKKRNIRKNCFQLESIFNLFPREVKCNPLRHSCTEVGWMCRPSITYFRTVVAHDNFDFI